MRSGLARRGMRSSALNAFLQTIVESSILHQKSGLVPSSQAFSSCEAEETEEIIAKLCKQNRPHEAFEAIAALNPNFITLSRDPLYHLLQYCLELKDLSAARKVHGLIISNGLDSLTVLLDHLIRLFSLSGSLQASYQVFLKISIGSVYTWNAIISAHAQFGEYKRALDLFNMMHQNVEVMPDKITYLCVLQACGNLKNVDSGRVIHEKIVASGLDSDLAIGSSLVHMYAQCGILQDMQQVFDELPNRDIISWGVIVSAYAQYGHDKVVLKLFRPLQVEGIQPDRGMYVLFLKSCSVLGDIEHGRLIHEHIKQGGSRLDIFLESTVIEMYSVCGNLKEAYDVFEQMINRDVVAWGSMMSAYIYHGHFLSALRLYEDMQHEGLQPDRVIFLCILKACSSLGELALGRIIHEHAVCHSLDSHAMIGNALLDLYAKCGSLYEVSIVFDKLPAPSVVSWDIMISAYADNGLVDIAFEMFNNMKHKGLSPSNVTFICILKACGSGPSGGKGRLIHDEIIRSGLELDAAIGNGIVDMYARCQTLDEATKVFNTLPSRNVVTWSALISGFAQSEDGLHALGLFEEMLQVGVTLDKVVFLSALKACASLQALREGWLINDKIIRYEYESHTAVGNSLVCMYAKCGSLEEGHKIFNTLPTKNVVSWGALIGGYAHHGEGHPALALFENMQQEGVSPDQATIVCALKACGSICAAEEGRLLHDLILRSEFASDKVIGNALVDMYLKCGSLRQAQKVFDLLTTRDIVSWTTLVVGYAQHGHGYVALELYRKLQQEGLQLTRVLYLCTLQACVSMGAIGQGRLVHEEARKSGIILDMAISNSLVELHAKWGDLEGAKQVFKELPCRDVVTWSVIMAGYASYGKCRQVTHCLEAMLEEGLEPDNMVFTAVLSACSNAGLLEESFVIFKSMIDHHGITPDLEHYSCVIDVLGRAGKLEEAFKLVHTLPIPPDDVVWQSLLANSKTYGSGRSGFLSFDQLQEMEHSNASSWDSNEIEKAKKFVMLHEVQCIEGKTMVDEWDLGGNGVCNLEGTMADRDVINCTLMSDNTFVEAPQSSLNGLPAIQVRCDDILSNYRPEQNESSGCKYCYKASQECNSLENCNTCPVDIKIVSKRVKSSLGKQLDSVVGQECRENSKHIESPLLVGSYKFVSREMNFETTSGVQSYALVHQCSFCHLKTYCRVACSLPC